MPSLELRPRLASEIVDAAFQLYRRHFAELVTLSAVVFAPYLILQLVLTGGQPAQFDPSAPGTSLIIIVGWIVGSFLEAAVVVSVSSSYLSGDPDIASALRHTGRRFGAVLLAVSAKWFLIGLGFFVAMFLTLLSSMVLFLGMGADPGAAAPGALVFALLVFVAMLASVPIGLYFFTSFFAVPATLMLEGLGVRAGLGRSRRLSQGFRWKVLGTLGLPMLILVVLQFIVFGLLQIVPGPAIVSFLAEQIASILISPILAVIATLLYYDVRIRKEGFDIEVMASELGAPAAVGPGEAEPA